MSLRAASCLLFCFAASAAQAATREYAIIFSGKVAGAQKVVTEDGGRLRIEFEYKDNGRGPELVERVTVGADGLPDRYAVTGKSTYGAAVAESFERDGDAYRWQADTGDGQASLANAVYVPIESSLEINAMIVRAAWRAPGHKLAIVPSGELAVRRIARTEVTVAGRPSKVALYATSGLGLSPQFVWLGDDLELFGFIYPGLVQMVPKGAEAEAAALERAQVAAEGELLDALALEHAHRLPNPIVVRNARIFDPETGELGELADIYVNAGRIAAVMEAGSPAREVGTELDAAGRVVLPGLFDMHTHESAWGGALHLAAGVTTVRDMGNDNAMLGALASKFEAGTQLGARVVAAGFIEGKSDFSSQGGFVIATLEEAKQAIDWYAERGFPQVKIYNSFPKELVGEAVAYAHRRGLRVSGHVPAFMRAEEVVKLGYDELQHVNQYMLNFFVKPGDDTRTLARFYIPAEKARTLDLDSRRVRDFIDLLVDRKVALDPTLNAFEDMLYVSGDMHPSYAAIEDHLPVTLRRALRTNSMDVTPAKLGPYRESYARMLGFVGRAHAAGVPLLAGTDSYPGFGLHRELALLVQAGLTPAQALTVATRNGAEYTGLGARLGRIGRGRDADLVIVDGDPLAHIADAQRAVLTMKSGVVYYPAELHAALGVKPFAPALKPVAAKPAATPAAGAK